ncbi:MAG: nucleotidyltransferase domain-containing protein, partial [Burkholderia gladioli]
MSVPALTATEAPSHKAEFRAVKAELISRFRAATQVEALMRALSRATDEALRQLWTDCDLPGSLALVAVGGFGRGELSPHSDVDILVLLPDAHGGEFDARIERFIGMAWDLGLEIGSSVRTVGECIDEAAQDVTVQTSLLEARRITGSLTLFKRAVARYREALDPRAFFQAKVLEMRQRHAKFQDTPYSLEPNVKESPGGLRDLQTILWIARAAGFGNSWRELDTR